MLCGLYRLYELVFFLHLHGFTSRITMSVIMEALQPLYDRAINVLIILGFLLTASIFSGICAYFIVLYARLRKRVQISLDMTTLEVQMTKDNEIKIDAAEQMFASFGGIKKSGFFKFLEVEDVIAFEIVGTKGEIRFYVSAPNKLIDLVEKTIYSYYPTANISKVDEPNIFTPEGKVAYGCLVQKDKSYLPLKTYKELPTDTLSSILSTLTKMSDGEAAMIQLLIRPADTKWKGVGKSYIASSKKNEASSEKATFKTDPKMLEKIDEKVTRTGFDTIIRYVVCSPTKEMADVHVRNLKAAYSQFNSDLNSLTTPKITFKGPFMTNFIYKFFPMIELVPYGKLVSIFSTDELAGLFHFPNKSVEAPNVVWLKAKTSAVSAQVPTEGGTLVGTAQYRGVKRPVHILLKDRMRHAYIIGRTGTGKSELLIEMIRQDIRAGYGVCVIDPHGDLIDDVLRFIPPQRAEDVILFDPSDTDRPIGLNLLESKTEEEKHFITGAIINLMYKLYDPQRTGIIGPRFEHAVRNAMLTIMCEPGATFVEIVRIMTDPKYVQELLPKVKDPIIRRYWTDQIAQTSDFHKSEVLDYIVSKFGKFITNTMMRNIIGQSKSAFDFRKVMDEGKILLVNLSKGKLGEENSTFLGLLVVPKILAAAMSRVDTPIDKRREFFLYVDEFQNFATPDFATILSEARKYKLSLTVANQFIGQMDEDVKNAVFGNVGTQMVLRTGVTDASFLQREFQPYFNETDIVNQERFHAYMKTIVNNEPVPPFSIDMTKDYAKHVAERDAGEKVAKAIMQLSRLKYGRPKEIVEAEIVQRARL